MTIAPDRGSCFLTVHATVLCVAAGGFVHAPLDTPIDRARLVVGRDPPAMLRTVGRATVELEQGGPALIATASGQVATVNLSLDGAFLSAGDTGGAVVRADAPHRWEEFLPVAPAALDRLRDLVARDWVSLPDRRFVAASASAMLPDFGVLVGGRTVSLRDADLLGGGAPDRMVLWAENRLAILQRVRPVLVFRHDGTAEADAEIALGVASLRAVGGFPGRVIVEIAGDPGGVDGVDLAARPAGAPGLLHFDNGTDPDAGPVLFVANGVLFDGPAAPIVAAAAALSRVAAAPWLRGAWELPPALDGEAVDPAIVAAPGGGAWHALGDLVAAARRLAPNTDTHGDTHGDGDGQDAAALQLALGADLPPGPNVLRSFVAAGGPDDGARPAAGRGLVNFRSVPREIRAEVMRAYLAR